MSSYLYFFALLNFLIQQAVLDGVTRRARLRQSYDGQDWVCLGLDWVCFGFDRELRGQKWLCIGFDWVCFPHLRERVNFCISLPDKGLCSFGHFLNWVCFA